MKALPIYASKHNNFVISEKMQAMRYGLLGKDISGGKNDNE